MSKIWSVLIVLSIVFCLVTNQSTQVVSIATSASNKAVENVLLLIGVQCFWCGIFNILKNTKIIECMSRFLRPAIKRVFKQKMSREAEEAVSLNMASNFIGVGNAATIYGIDAMKKMQQGSADKENLSRNMELFILINTASIQLIPASIISLRIVYGATWPNWIVLPNLLVSFISLAVGMLFLKIISGVKKC